MIQVRARFGHIDRMPRCQHGRVICRCFDDDCYLGKVAAPANLGGAGDSRASAAGTLTDTGHVRTHVAQGNTP